MPKSGGNNYPSPNLFSADHPSFFRHTASSSQHSTLNFSDRTEVAYAGPLRKLYNRMSPNSPSALSVAHGTVNLQHVHFDVRRDRTYTLRARTMLLIQEYAPLPPMWLKVPSSSSAVIHEPINHFNVYTIRKALDTCYRPERLLSYPS